MDMGQEIAAAISCPMPALRDPSRSQSSTLLRVADLHAGCLDRDVEVSARVAPVRDDVLVPHAAPNLLERVVEGDEPAAREEGATACLVRELVERALAVGDQQPVAPERAGGVGVDAPDGDAAPL